MTMAEHAVAQAQETAKKVGVALDAVADDDDHFAWGSSRHDLATWRDGEHAV